MCLKYKDKGHSKMHPGVPEYILCIYIFWCWRQSLGTTAPKKFLAKLEELLWVTMERKSMRNRISCVKSKNAQN